MNKMNNKEYVDLVNQGNYPEDNIVPLDPAYQDERGSIQNLWLGESKSVTLITTKKGGVRASHTHSNDWHAIHVISGSIQYLERNQDGSNRQEKIIKSGEMIFTKPEVVHKVIALEDTIFLTVNGIVKNAENYAKTMTKVEF